MLPRTRFRTWAASHHFPGLILLPLLLGTACSSPTPDSPGQTTAPAPPTADAGLAAGQALFAQRCAACHGADGKLGLNGAHDLTRSNLNATGRVYMVTNGLGKMPAFKAQLTAAEIEQVVAYSLTLR